MRFLAALLALAFLLAGCSGGGSDDGGAPTASSTPSTSAAPPPPPVPTTDTLHFLAAPTMTPLVPTGSDERTPVTTANFGGGPGGQQQPGAVWRHVVTQPTNITGAEVHTWVDIKEQMFDTRTDPVQPRCTWSIRLEVGLDTEPAVACVNEQVGPINPGVKELVFTLVLDGKIELEANETIQVTLSRTAFSLSANNAVDALSGSAEHDSRVILKGLKEPMKA